MADSRPIVYVEDDAIVYRASAIGACPTALIAARLGYEAVGVPDAVQQAADEGCRLEPIALDYLREHGWQVRQSQQVTEREHLCIWGRLLVRGHVDGIGDDGRGPVLVEVKSRNAETFGKLQAGAELPEQHLWQMSAYAHALGLDRVAYVAISRATQEVYTRVMPVPVPWADITARMETVEESAALGIIPTCYGRRDVWCGYQHLHEQRPYDLADDLREIAAEYHRAASAVREWEAARDSLRGPLLQAMGERRRVIAGSLAIERIPSGRGERLTVREVSA